MKFSELLNYFFNMAFFTLSVNVLLIKIKKLYWKYENISRRSKKNNGRRK